MGFLRAALMAGRVPARKAMNMIPRAMIMQLAGVNSTRLKVGKSARNMPG